MFYLRFPSVFVENVPLVLLIIVNHHTGVPDSGVKVEQAEKAEGKPEGDGAPASPVELDMKQVKGDVFEFLRQQRAMEKTVSGLGKDIEAKKAKPTLEEFMADDADISIGGSAEPEEEVKKITPYKSDIEYLDDQVCY